MTTVKQGKFESLNECYDRFKDTVQVTEAEWGALVPTELTGTGEETLEKPSVARDECLACVFLVGAGSKHQGCIAELNNSFLSGNDKLPKSPSNALEFLNNCMTGEQPSKQHNKKAEEKADDDVGEVNAAQKAASADQIHLNDQGKRHIILPGGKKKLMW